MEQRLQIHQHRLLAGGDEIFEMHVGCLKDVEQRKVAALSLVEATHASFVSTGSGLDELTPAVGVSIQEAESAKRRLDAPGV